MRFSDWRFAASVSSACRMAGKGSADKLDCVDKLIVAHVFQRTLDLDFLGENGSHNPHINVRLFLTRLLDDLNTMLIEVSAQRLDERLVQLVAGALGAPSLPRLELRGLRGFGQGGR